MEFPFLGNPSFPILFKILQNIPGTIFCQFEMPSPHQQSHRVYFGVFWDALSQFLYQPVLHISMLECLVEVNIRKENSWSNLTFSKNIHCNLPKSSSVSDGETHQLCPFAIWNPSFALFCFNLLLTPFEVPLFPFLNLVTPFGGGIVLWAFFGLWSSKNSVPLGEGGEPHFFNQPLEFLEGHVFFSHSLQPLSPNWVWGGPNFLAEEGVCPHTKKGVSLLGKRGCPPVINRGCSTPPK